MPRPAVSTFDLFKVGIGPSSSHTVGPMRAAQRFVMDLQTRGLLDRVRRLTVELYGSLALTGVGHGSDKAILLGLAGETPEEVDPHAVTAILGRIRDDGRIALLGMQSVPFDESQDIIMHFDQVLERHTNGMRFTAADGDGRTLHAGVYYSVGGGFVVGEAEAAGNQPAPEAVTLPYPFDTGEALLALGRAHGLSIAELMLANERSWRDDAETYAGLRKIWRVMQDCVERGLTEEGRLPGGLGVMRRAKAIYQELTRRPEAGLKDQLSILDWVNVYALAVNEENAAGGRVVTAPTNGAAGIVPAVLHYYDRFCARASERGVFEFLLTAAAIGVLYKKNASISGAEVGCQGEVGVACSMAAAGLAAALGGSNEQIENAAEIGMEHNLGLTCDPIGGLVQIPCIERNAMGAVKAINAARLALKGDGTHFVPLDKVIETMRQTGADMSTKYKETSLGGLAINVVPVNVVEC
jgi:L-serine dehydratase